MAVTQRHDQIQDAIAIQVSDTNIIAGGKRVAARHQCDNWLAHKSSIAHTKQNRELRISAADRHIVDSTAVQIHYRHGVRGSSDINLARRLKCAVAVAEQDSDATCGTAWRGEPCDAMHHHQIEPAIAIEIRRQDSGRIESGSVWEKGGGVEAARASTGKQCEAELRTV